MLASRYPTTKLLEIYAVRQLASLRPVSDTAVVINAVSPGLCYSELDRNGNIYLRMMLAVMRKFLARTSEQGSRNLLQAAFARSESHGAYCSECQVKEYDSFPPTVSYCSSVKYGSWLIAPLTDVMFQCG